MNELPTDLVIRPSPRDASVSKKVLRKKYFFLRKNLKQFKAKKVILLMYLLRLWGF